MNQRTGNRNDSSAHRWSFDPERSSIPTFPFPGIGKFSISIVYRYHFWLFLLGKPYQIIEGSALQLLIAACKCASNHARDSRSDTYLRMAGGGHGLSSHAFRWDKTEVPTPE
jgi:hypothetical protein